LSAAAEGDGGREAGRRCQSRRRGRPAPGTGGRAHPGAALLPLAPGHPCREGGIRDPGEVQRARHGEPSSPRLGGTGTDVCIIGASLPGVKPLDEGVPRGRSREAPSSRAAVPVAPSIALPTVSHFSSSASSTARAWLSASQAPSTVICGGAGTAKHRAVRSAEGDEAVQCRPFGWHDRQAVLDHA
jgi:hypothetical protein